MADLPIIVFVAVFAASMLQSITGIGFGVLAGPVLIVVLASSAAIQLSILLSFLIAVLLAPTLYRDVNRSLLAHLLVGVVVGTPLGLIAARTLDIDALKLIAAVVVGFMTLVASGLLKRVFAPSDDTAGRRGVAGAISGILNATLAMPGPPVAAYASAIRHSKEAVRATTLTMFLVAYPIAFSAQVFGPGINPETWRIALLLTPFTVAGTFVGALLSRFIPAFVFRCMTLFFLVASVALLVLG